ncbi:MAG: arylsulfatase [Sedimentisphaeraceae bacterium JB056]
MKKKPNIVYILADDLGYGDLGCYGAEKIPTPNIDAIAKEGMRFSDAHSSSAVCTPSRYSILTGRYCWRSRLKEGVLGGFSLPLIEDGRATAASVLESAGYNTACIGKWHLGLKWYTKDGSPKYSDGQGDYFDSWNTETGFDVDYQRGFEKGPLDYGFDSFFGIAGSLDMPPYCFLEDDKCADIPTKEKDIYYPQQRRGLMSDNWDDKLCDYTFAMKAVDYLDSRAKADSEDPFFLYLPTAAPHRPCLPPDFMEGASDAGDKGDMVAMFDWVVGQVVDTLKKNGQWDNTLLIVTSDNGARRYCFNGEDYGHKPNGNLRGQKADIWEGGHREPLIVTWPAVVEADSVCEKMVCLSDFVATCFDLADIDKPSNVAEDSCSMMPLLSGKPGDYERKNLIHHSFWGCFAIRKGDWKLVTSLGSGGFTEPVSEEQVEGGPEGQLYNIAEDIEEKENLWLKEPQIRQSLIELLNSLM